MPYVIGTDEAGYGPNLGPLLIAATVWRVPGDPCKCDLYKLLKKSVCAEGDDGERRRLWIADSKAVYKSGHGLADLERGTLAAVASAQRGPRAIPDTCRAVWSAFDPLADEHHRMAPWPVHFHGEVPLAAQRDELRRAADALKGDAAAAGVTLEAIRATAVYPERFNALTAELGTKGEVLSRLTLTLVAELLATLDDEPVLILCDKHGGRNHYVGLLQDIFIEHIVEVLDERRAESRYRWGKPDCRTEIRVRVKSEAFLPVALASLSAKYLRELAMRAFNDFWCAHVPEFRPTAGYPVDARRFKDAIAAAQQSLGIDDHALWRNR